MALTHDADIDVLSLVLNDAPVEESDEEKPGVILDYDKDGNIVGLEILQASKRIANPRAVECAVVSRGPTRAHSSIAPPSLSRLDVLYSQHGT